MASGHRVESNSPGSAFRIIVHGSPPIDHGVRYWTEAPACPVAHDGGASVEDAVERTKDRIRTWCTRRAGGDPTEPLTIEFLVEEAL